MADQKHESFASKLLIPVIIAIVAGGSAPWWWGKIHESHPVDVALRKEGEMSWTDPQKGAFTVGWRNLSLHYNTGDLEYSAALTTSFPGCQSCLSQILIWVGDTAYQGCIFEGSANTGSKTVQGHIEVPEHVSSSGKVPIYLIASLDNNCAAAQAGKSQAGKQVVGYVGK